MLGIGIGITSNRKSPVAGGGGGGGGVNAVTFDGTNDNLARGAQLTGAVDGENLLISLWFNFVEDNILAGDFLAGSGDGFRVSRLGTRKIRITLHEAGGSDIWVITSTLVFDFENNTGWHNLLIAAELDVTPVAHVWLDDALLAHTVNSAPANGNIDFTGAQTTIGSDVGGGSKLNGDLAEVYMAAEFLDISVEANRRKFIDGDGKPVDLGEDGSTPTGNVPLIFLSGATDAWHTNKGSGEGFTENGALTDAASSPSD